MEHQQGNAPATRAPSDRSEREGLIEEIKAFLTVGARGEREEGDLDGLHDLLGRLEEAGREAGQGPLPGLQIVPPAPALFPPRFDEGLSTAC